MIDEKTAFYEAWRKNGLPYGNDPIDVYHEPYIIEKDEALQFQEVTQSLHNLIEKITRLFIDGHFRKVYQFDPRLFELILHDPGYSISSPFCRWDSFYDRANLKFIELNTDGTSGMCYVEELERIFLQHLDRAHINSCHFKEKILQTLIHCYKEFCQPSQGQHRNFDDHPQIAIIDWEDVPTRPEQLSLCHFFEQNGFSAILADPRSLNYRGKHLFKDDFRIDLIYRRVVTREYLEKWNEVSAMTKAFLDQNVCVVGSFRSEIGFDKRTFVILSSHDYDSFFTPEENHYRSLHIPWTRLLEEGIETYQHEEIHLPDYLMRHPEQFILKPPSSNRGKGVVSGDGLSKEKWINQIRKRLGTGDIVQERVSVPKWGPKNWGLHLGHFIFNGVLAGWMCRGGLDPILSDRSDDYLIPCFLET